MAAAVGLGQGVLYVCVDVERFDRFWTTFWGRGDRVWSGRSLRMSRAWSVFERFGAFWIAFRVRGGRFWLGRSLRMGCCGALWSVLWSWPSVLVRVQCQ